MSLVARVVPDVTGVDKVFDYLIPSDLQNKIAIGDRVRVPLHGRNVPGWVMEIGSTEESFTDVDPAKLRSVIKWLGFGASAEVVALAKWASQRYSEDYVHFLFQQRRQNWCKLFLLPAISVSK